MATRADFDNSINAFLTPLDVNDKITSQDVKDAFAESLDYTDEVYTGLDAKITEQARELFIHDKNSNITFSYDPVQQIIKAAVASSSVINVDASPTENSTNAVASGSVYSGLAAKEPKLPTDAGTVEKYLSNAKTWKNLDKAAVGLNKVDNTTDAEKPVSTAQGEALAAKADLVLGKVPMGQMDDRVTQVVPLSSLSAFPTTGLSGKLYIATDTNFMYRWNGSGYTQVGGGSGGNVTVTGSSVEIRSIASLKTLDAPNAGLLYHSNDIGREGLWYYDASTTATSTMGDDGLTIFNSKTNRLYRRIFDGKNVQLSWFGTLTNYREILRKLWTAEYVVHGSAGVKYPIIFETTTGTKNIDITDKNIYFKGNGCTLSMSSLDLSHGDRLLTHRVTFGTAANILGFADAANIGTGFQGADEITVAGLIDAKQGDVFRIHSKELCHPMFVGGTGSDGEWAPIMKAENIVVQRVVQNTTASPQTTTLNIQGNLKYDYIINSDLKISKYGDKTVDISDVNIELTTSSSTGFVRLVGTFLPRFDKINTRALNYPVFQFESTHLAKVSNCNLYGMVDGSTRSYGYNYPGTVTYGVNDNSGWATHVDACNFYNIRHCYTTGSGGVSGAANDCGEPVSARITNCYAKQCYYAFDSHAQGLDIFFGNCFAEDGVGGFQARARGTTISGGKAKNCDKGVLIQTEHNTSVPATRTSFTEYTSVIGVHTVACGNAIEIDNDSGIQMPTKVTGCVFEGGTMVFKGGNTEVSGCIHTTIGKKGGGEPGEWMVVENGATVRLTNHSTTFNAAYTNGFKINATSSCNVYIDGLRLINKGTNNFRFYSASSTPTTKTSILVMKNVTVIGKGPMWNPLDSTVSERFPAREADGLLVLRMQWSVESMTSTQELGKSSSWLEEKSSSTIPLVLHNHLMLDPEVNMNVTIHTAMPYTMAPGAFYGQKVRVFVNGATLTLNGTALVAGAVAEYIYVPTGWKVTSVVNPLS